jgi:hypothetical protein
VIGSFADVFSSRSPQTRPGKGQGAVVKRGGWGQSSFISHQSSAINHQPSAICHQSSVINHQSSTISRRSSAISHQSSVILSATLGYFHQPLASYQCAVKASELLCEWDSGRLDALEIKKK